MLSKNNYQERLRKMERKQERFSIRKFSVGAASVLIGVLFFMNEGPTNHVVHASELTGQNVTVKANTGDTSTNSEGTTPTESKQVAQEQQGTPASVAAKKTAATSENATPESEAPKSDAVKSDAPKSGEDKSATPASEAKSDADTKESTSAAKDEKATDKKNATNILNVKDLKGNTLSADALKVSKVATDEHTANVDNFADLSKAIANKDINTINLTKDIDLTNMTEKESQVDGGLVSGGTGSSGDNWLQPYELAANKTSNSPFTSIARDLTVNGNDHTVNLDKWFISLWNQNQDDTNGWKLTFNDMKVKNNSTSTRYTPIYFGNMNSANLKRVTLTFNNFQADLNTPLTNDEDGVDVIFKGKDIINVSPLTDNTTGSIQGGADRNIIFARNVLIDDNADVSITASMLKSLTGGIFQGVQDEEHNVIKLSPDTSDSSDPAGSMAVGKNAKLTINTNGIDGKGSTTSLRGIASRNVNGTLTLNEGATVNMTLGKGHSSAVLLSNLDLKKGSTLNIDTMQDNWGFSQRSSGNMGSDGWIYAPIALGAISFSQTGNARLTVADGATLKMTRGNVKTSTAMIQLGGSTVFGGQSYDLEFADGSTIDIQDASDNEGLFGLIPSGKKEAYSPLIYIQKSSKVGTIGQVKYLNLQRTNPNGYSVGNLIDASSGIHMDAGKFGGVDIKQWDKGNNNAEPNKTWQVENFSEESSGKINAAGMAPVDNNKLNDFLSSVNLTKGTQQRLVMTSMDLEAYNYDARYNDSTAKVGETINIDAPTFYQVGENGTLTPANPNPDLLDNTMSGHPYQLGWAQTGNVTIPQGATIDSATGKITFAANQGQVGTVVNIPVTVTYKDDSIDQVIAPVYVLGNDTTPVWQKDENGNTTGVVAIQYAAGNLPETTDKSAQVSNIADNYKLTYYAIPTKDNPEVTPVDLTNYGKVTWANTPSTVVDTATNSETVTTPVALSFTSDSVAVKNGYVKAGTQTADLNLDLTGATAKNTDLGFSKKSIDNGLTQTQFKRLVDTTALDNAGISYTLSWAQTPTTKSQNSGVVRVTYPSVMQADGTTPAYLDIPVQYKVNDPAQTADDVDVTYPTTATSAKEAATITPVITDNDGNTITVPEGTKFAIDGNAPAGATIDPSTGVVTIPATNTTGVTTVPVTVTYPDGSTTQTTVKSVSVATNDDVKNPTSPYDMIKDPANLPAGTKVTWADDNTPVAGDNVPAKVIVTVPGAEPIEVTGTAHYDDNAIYTPQVKNPVQATPESLPDATAQIMNMDKLPEGTTAAWQDGQQVPVTAGQTIPGVIVVTYPDGSTDKVSTTITTTGITDADQYTPVAADVKVPVGGQVPEAAKAIANADQMPEGTTYEWTTEPDVSKAGQTTGEVTVTYPDGTTDTVTVPVTVTAEKVDKTALQDAVDEAPEVEKTPAYINSNDDAKKAYDDAVNAGKTVLDDPAATQDQVDKATKAIEDAKTGLDGKPDSDTYTPEASTDVKIPVGGQVPDAATTITNAKDMPEGTTYEWTKTPDTSKVGETTGEVTVTYPDGTTDTVTVPVTVEGADKTDLQKAVDEAPTVEKTPAYINGTDDAKKAYDDAVNAGKTVLDNPDATQAQVDKATKAIEDAKTGLDGKITVNPYYPATSSSASEANSAADVAKSNASSAASNASTASNAASAASSAAEKNSAAKSDADKASSAASVASSAAEKASSAASIASSAASDADVQKSIASEQDSIASSAASAGDSTAASEAQSKASEAADKASEDAKIAKSAASESSSAASEASSAASTASDAASAAESEANKKPIDVTPYEPAASSSASEANSAADVAKSNASSAASNASTASNAASEASSAAEKNSAAKSDADKASSAASVASSASEKASSAASTASSAASDADKQKSIASEQDSIASSAASAGNSSAASEAQSKASDAAKKASEDADIAKSAASEASSAQSTASSAASTASDAASAAESEANKKPIDVTPYEPAAASSASEASSAADVAKSNASSAASNASTASSAASVASSAAEKNSAAKSDADKASSAASVASSASEKASSAASTASSAASDADKQKSIASEQDSIASSAASVGDSSAASEAQSKASDAAKKASEDADIAKSAASESSSAASEASSASSTASSAASEATSIANSSASSDYSSEASSAASEAGSHASDASSSSSNASSAASEAKSNADKDPNNSKASSAASTASSAASTASSASSTASSAASDASSAASIASSAQSEASSYASEGNSSAASSAESKASSAASQAKSDDSVASSAASTASSAASVASSAASTASSAASEGSSSANSSAASSANSDYASEASSAASEAGSHASDASNSSSAASSSASEAKSNADKDPNNSTASSAASTASSAASTASSASSTASSAASDASSAASVASSAQSAASSFASQGNSSAASSAESVASSAASQAKSDASVASSAASTASSAASVASSAASTASSAASEGSSSANSSAASSASSDYASQASSAASDAKSHASEASSSASHASSAASEAKSNADKNPTDSAAKSDANKASSAASVASSAASTASSAASDASNAASTASSAQSAALSYASQGNSSAASSAESVASSAASQAKKDDSIASSAASEASSAASTASEASGAVNDDLNPSSAASSAATNAGKYASEASSSASVASSAASVASSAAATDPNNSQVASDASVASTASSIASSAASTASSAASAASSAASEANKAQQEADSYAKEGNSSAATSAHAKAQSYASDAKSDESVASSAASVASSAAEVAKSAADDAEKAAQADQNNQQPDNHNTGDNTDTPQQPTDNNNNGKSDNNNSGNKDNTGKNTDNGNQGKDNTNKGTTGNNPAGKGGNNKGAGTNQSSPVITDNPTNFAGNNASAADSLLDAQRPLSEQAEALAEEGYVVTVGPHGQIIDYYPAADGQGMIIYVDANGNVIGKVKVGKAGQLPQTGAKNNEAGIFGLALASIAGFFGLAAGKKRKKND